MENMTDDKIYFVPGNLVKLKHNLPNSPVMMVTEIKRNYIKNTQNPNNLLKGIKVRWFTDNGFLQEATFSTKDLVLV